MHKHLGLTVLIAAALICFSVCHVRAHKPLLAVEDNRDGTIYVEAGFSDGSSAAGHKIILKEETSGKVISEHKVGEDGTLEVDKPKVPYTVTLDAGEGHMVTQPGPPPSASAPSASEEPAQAKETAEPAPKAPTQVAAPAKTAPVPQTSDLRLTQPAPAGPALSAQATGEVSSGAIMAFKMMITTQIVTATALIILLVVVVYFVGYTAGKNAAVASRRREV